MHGKTANGLISTPNPPPRSQKAYWHFTDAPAPKGVKAKPGVLRQTWQAMAEVGQHNYVMEESEWCGTASRYGAERRGRKFLSQHSSRRLFPRARKRESSWRWRRKCDHLLLVLWFWVHVLGVTRNRGRANAPPWDGTQITWLSPPCRRSHACLIHSTVGQLLQACRWHAS